MKNKTHLLFCMFWWLLLHKITQTQLQYFCIYLLFPLCKLSAVSFITYDFRGDITQTWILILYGVSQNSTCFTENPPYRNVRLYLMYTSLLPHWHPYHPGPAISACYIKYLSLKYWSYLIGFCDVLNYEVFYKLTSVVGT